MSTVEDHPRFDELKVYFGSEDDADQLTFAGFALLPDEEMKNYKIKDELLKIRARSKQAAAQASSPAGMGSQ